MTLIRTVPQVILTVWTLVNLPTTVLLRNRSHNRQLSHREPVEVKNTPSRDAAATFLYPRMRIHSPCFVAAAMYDRIGAGDSQPLGG